jgi:general L-amino acid transport system permease protein
MTELIRKPPIKKTDYTWRSQIFRGKVYQLIMLLIVVFILISLSFNMNSNMKARGIQSGFDFMLQPTGFDIGESLMGFDSAQPYWVAFLVGLSNTLRVAILGILLTTILGTILGIGRFSRNIIVRAFCASYVSFFRNIPLLLQLFMWYILLTEFLPEANQPFQVSSLFLSKAGFSFPKPVWSIGYLMVLLGLLLGCVSSWWQRRRAFAYFDATGQIKSTVLVPFLYILLFTVFGWLLGGMPSKFDNPIMGVFSVENGGALTPEFLAVLLGLTVYTAAFVAEVVRSGIASVSIGQREAARALGLSPSQEIRLVILPQALRVIIPPMTNQYLNLTKNSSLAVAIGYPDIVSIANTSINQTGRAIESIAVIMVVYLATSLITAIFMNSYNNRTAIKER